ncbi:MAG: flippase-like domain-containing protein [Deltaproteobacteria bacterium]|nr:flippase-like domain-containing protein [Deltaproteobacteria bacterium]MBW2015668.1 flippase-like domain-containing protein [Deltaproteobacteria bacterium]MBW2128616.1 flippase-like domain-containing protein [Deltaproteobacteria bacterium]
MTSPLNKSPKAADWKLWAGILISAVFIFLAFRKVDTGRMWMVLKSANLSSILMIVVFTFLQYVARAWRWAILLEPIQTTGFRNRIQAVLIGFAANCVFPARLGEFIRANLLGRKEKLSGSSILGTILVERLFDGFTLLLILAIGLSGTTFTGEWSAVSGSLRGTGYALFFTYLLVILFIVGFKYKTRECLNLLDRLLFFFPKKLRKKSIEAIRNFSLGLVLLRSPVHWAGAILLSILVWTFGIVQIQFTELSLGLNLPLIAAFLVMAMGSFGAMIPSAPGFIGTFHLAVQYAFLFYGLDKEEALSAAILWHAAVVIPTVLAGLLAFLSSQFSTERTEKKESEILEKDRIGL